MVSAMTLHVALILGLVYQTWLHLRLVPVKQYTSSYHLDDREARGRSSLMGSMDRDSDLEVGQGGAWQDSPTGIARNKDAVCCLCNYCHVSAMCNPCGHAVMCFNCASRRIDTARPVCPLCEEQLTDIFELAVEYPAAGDETAEA